MSRGKNYLQIAMECLRVTGNLPIYKKTYEGTTLNWKSKRDKKRCPEMPSLPTSKSDVSYEIDRECRIVRADLTNLKDRKCPKEDLEFILSCMECADLTLVLRGLFMPLVNVFRLRFCLNLRSNAFKQHQDPERWNWKYLVKRCGHIMYHAYKTFVWDFGSQSFVERGWISMSISDYDRYLGLRSKVLGRTTTTTTSNETEGSLVNTKIEKIFEGNKLYVGTVQSFDTETKWYRVVYEDGDSEDLSQEEVRMRRQISEPTIFEYVDAEGMKRLIDVRNVVVYLIDLPLPQYLPELMIDLESKARIDLLPSGRFCMQRFVAPSVRPFMGPNIYITPPGSSTYFHADGHGTVDSGHFAMCGYNEVIMLRRLDQNDKQRALDAVREDKEYSLEVQPHDDTTYKTKPPWPSLESVNVLREKGFAPSHFVLQPQEYVHINKGRLHAFRKVSKMPRNEFVSNLDVKKNVSMKQRNSNEVCISVAWDWIFQGHSARGIQEEVGVALEAAVANHRGAEKTPVYSLGKTETCAIGALRAALATDQSEAVDVRDAIDRNVGLVFDLHLTKKGKSGERYDRYKVAKTCSEAIQLGASRADLRYDLVKGIAKIVEIKEKAVPICWNKSWISCEDEKEEEKEEDKHLGKEEAKRILRGLGGAVLDHISKPYDEDEVVQEEEEEIREEEEEILRQSDDLKYSLDIFEASHRAVENLVSDENDESTESKASTAEFDSRLQDAIKEARQARHDLKSVCDEILNVLRKKARDQMWHPKGLSVDDSVVDVAVPRLQQTIDPYGAGGFTCEACLKEMPNMYYHCVACELLLKKDFNVCVECARDHLHEVNTLEATSAMTGHFGSIDWSAKQRSGQMCSHRAASCGLCGFCVKCSCRCHTVLQKRFRFANQDQFESFVEKVRDKTSKMKSLRTGARTNKKASSLKKKLAIDKVRKSRIFITTEEDKVVRTFEDLLLRGGASTRTSSSKAAHNKKRKFIRGKYVKRFGDLTKHPTTGMFYCKCGRASEMENSIVAHMGRMQGKDGEDAHGPIDFSNGIPEDMPETCIQVKRRKVHSNYKPAYPDLKPDSFTGTYLCVCGRDFGSNERAMKVHMTKAKGKHGPRKIAQMDDAHKNGACSLQTIGK